MVKMGKTEITPEIIREFLDYDPETGELTWRERHLKWFPSEHSRNVWNGANAGKNALETVKDDGYKHGTILYRTIKAHRAAFAHFHGRWPADCLDHKNGNRQDNRIVNLAESSRAKNAFNRGKRSNNTSGVTGVHWCKTAKRWIARIKKHGKETYLGSFEDLDDAVEARRVAERKFGFSERHGK